MAKCDRCDGEALYQVHGELLCRDCLVEEYGLCAVCANVETCEDRDDEIIADLCSEFEEVANGK